MRISFEIIEIKKRYPLRISRGISTGSKNLFVFIEEAGEIGIGECAPGTGDSDDSYAVQTKEILESHVDVISKIQAPMFVWKELKRAGIKGSAMAGVDIAIWDLLAKQAKMPLYKMLGLPKPRVPTSVTIGINPEEVIRERVPEILSRTQAKALKIKLGNPEGTGADRASYEVCREVALPFGVKLRVDANGGWVGSDIESMIEWLSTRDCDYVEQPVAAGQESEILTFFDRRKLPIFLDESICTSQDVVRFGNLCDGINLKLMKTGGITEALRLNSTARAFGLKTMIGCMGETNIAISAGASLGALFDHIDLDSHLNLDPDPAKGAELVDGVVLPAECPGHGASLIKP